MTGLLIFDLDGTLFRTARVTYVERVVDEHDLGRYFDAVRCRAATTPDP